jgi:hypothetical protein
MMHVVSVNGMADEVGPSEFGGKPQLNRVQPSTTPAGTKGHAPDPSERLMLVYTTGDESGLSDPDGGEAFAGLLPLEEALKLLPEQEKFGGFS